MRFKLMTAMILACVPLAAGARVTGPLAAQGSVTTVGGIAHIERDARGTSIILDNPDAARNVAGFIAFNDEPSFRGLEALNGREVEITGVVVLDGRAMIVLTDPAQLRIAG